MLLQQVLHVTLSANQSAYNAIEPRQMSSNQSQHAPSASKKSHHQPQSIDGQSAQSIAFGLSNATIAM